MSDPGRAGGATKQGAPEESGGHGRRPAAGDSIGIESTLYILRRILGTESLEDGIEQTADYFLELFDLDFYGIFLIDRIEERVTAKLIASRGAPLHFLYGVSYRPGASAFLDDFLARTFASSPLVMDAREIAAFIDECERARVFSPEASRQLAMLAGAQGEASVASIGGTGRGGEPLVLCIAARKGALTRSEAELISRIMNAVAFAIDERLEFRRVERELTKYRTLIDTQETAFFLIVDGRIDLHSAKLARVLGAGDADLRGRRLEEALDPAEGPGLAAMISQLTGGAASSPRRYFKVCRAPGGGREVEITLEAVEYDGKPAIRGAARDVSERRQLESLAVEEKHFESLATFAGGVAHDFNNLIGAMVGYASLVRGSLAETDERYGYIQRIEEAGARAAGLTRQLLLVSRKGSFRSEVVDLREVLERVGKGCLMPMDRVSITSDIRGDSLFVEGDPTHLYEALLNICLNAREAMPAGGVVRIEADAVTIERASPIFVEGMQVGPYVRVRVRDTGVGMAPEVLRRAADPFFTTKREQGKRGLGLPAAVGIIESHRGKLLLSSAPGEGTEAIVLLPLTSKRPAVIVPYKGAESTGPRRVLVVDDEEIICNLARDMLKRLEYEAVVARSGREALEIVRTTPVDLVLLDLLMPEMGGQETFYRLREIAPDLPIIVSTGFSDESDIRRLLNDGATSFLRKPYHLRDLSEALRGAVAAGGRAAGG